MSTTATAMAALALIAGPPDAEHQAAPRPTRQVYLQAGLGGGAVWRHRAAFADAGGGLTFGIEAGAMLPDRGRRRVAVGGSFSQTGHGAAGAGWPTGSATDALVKVRVGGVRRRVWGYGIGGLGMSIINGECRDCLAIASGPVAALGAGLRIAFRHRTSLGFETDGVAMWRPTRGMLARLSGSVVFALRFGGPSDRE